MTLYKKYLFQKTLLSFLAICLLLVTLIWFSKTISFVRYITENGIELSQFLLLFLLILPWLLIFIIPISLFVAVVAIVNKLTLSNEITILKNSGLTNFSISKPIIKISIYASLFCFFISFFVMPYANKKLRLEKINFENNYSNISFSSGVFETLKSLTIYVKHKDEAGNLFGIIIHDERNPQYSLTITAKHGELSFENDSLLLYMQSGTLQKFNRNDTKSEILSFDDYVFNLSDNKGENEDGKMKWKPKERYFGELINPKDNPEAKDLAQYRSEIQQRIVYPLMPFIITLIAVSIMLRGSFNRHGNTLNIILSSIIAIIFLTSTIMILRLIETKFHLIIILYLNLLFFTLIHLKILLPNFLKKYSHKNK